MRLTERERERERGWGWWGEVGEDPIMLQAIYIYLCINNLFIDWSLCANFDTSVHSDSFSRSSPAVTSWVSVISRSCASFAGHFRLLLSLTKCRPRRLTACCHFRMSRLVCSRRSRRSRLAFTFGHIFGSQCSLQVAFVHRIIRFTFTICEKVFGSALTWASSTEKRTGSTLQSCVEKPHTS